MRGDGRAGVEEPARAPIVRVENLHRSYGRGAAAVHALRGVSFEIPRGELVALKGRSGSGKTTLLNLVGGLDSPDEGRITVDGSDLSELGEDGLLALRRDRVGFIFQSFGLIPILSAAENVGVPMRLRKADPREREDRVALLLSLVGLGDHGAQRPGELSGGQQQRVAIARCNWRPFHTGSRARSDRVTAGNGPTGRGQWPWPVEEITLLHNICSTAVPGVCGANKSFGRLITAFRTPTARSPVKASETRWHPRPARGVGSHF
nr:ABC transporter ATP-binding protein [Streptomyces sp. NRRL B-24720]